MRVIHPQIHQTRKTEKPRQTFIRYGAKHYPGDVLCFQKLHSVPVQKHSKRNTTLLGVGEPLRAWHFAGNSHFNSVGFSELVPARKTLCTCNLNFCSLRMSQLNKHKRMLAEGLGGQKSLPQVQLELRTGYAQAKFNSRASWWNKVVSVFLFRY